MRVYLVRHGEATPETIDPEQPLSERGRDGVVRLAHHAAALHLGVTEIWHSPKLRARQTAEVLAEHLVPPRGRREMDWLTPMADPSIAAEALALADEPVMLVGHLPHLGRLASLLLVGDSAKGLLRFPNAALACLDRSEDGWLLAGMLTPALLVPPA
jgi:phosphohistidine phosphatase